MKKPDHLPPYPKAPKGYHFEYRGKGWRALNVRYTYHDGDCWMPAFNIHNNASGFRDYHYAELVKNVTNDVPEEFEEQIAYAKSLLGKTIYSREFKMTGIPTNFIVIHGAPLHYFEMHNNKIDQLIEKFNIKYGFCIVMTGRWDNGNRIAYPIAPEHPPILEKPKPKIKINGYEATYFDDYIKFGCAKISKQQLKDARDFLHDCENEYPDSNRETHCVKIGLGEFCLKDLNALLEE